MTGILTGVVSGILIFSAIVFLIIKLPKGMQDLLYRHALWTDVGFTLFAFNFLPVVGNQTLISTGTFCLLMSVYLYLRNPKQA